jgi:hypothetical protein
MIMCNNLREMHIETYVQIISVQLVWHYSQNYILSLEGHWTKQAY